MILWWPKRKRLLTRPTALVLTSQNQEQKETVTFVAVALKEIICVPHRGTILNELRPCPQSKVNTKKL